MKQQSTLFDKIISRIKNNPVTASVIMLGTIVIALATFTDAAKSLISLINKNGPVEARAELAKLSLDFTPETFLERVSEEDFHAVDLFLNAEMDPDIKVGEGWTALMEAVCGGNQRMIDALLIRKANVNEKGAYGLTALSIALGPAVRGVPEIEECRNEKLLRQLLTSGVNTETINDALITAARGGKIEELRLLLDGGAGINGINAAFVEAAKNNNRESLRILLDKGVEIKKVGHVALIKLADRKYAYNDGANQKQDEIIKLLLDHDSNVNSKDKKDFTPLIAAVKGNNLSLVQALLDAGADVNARCEPCLGKMSDALSRLVNNGEYTALLVASMYGYDDIAKVLLNKGADVSVRYYNEITALMWATGHRGRSSGTKITKTLLAHGADVNAKDSSGANALIMAASNDRHKILKILLENGAEVNIQDEDGRTALMETARRGYLNLGMIKSLLGYKADVNVQDKDGISALMLARGRVKLIQILLEAGANSSAIDNEGRTALDHYGKTTDEIINLLQVPR